MKIDKHYRFIFPIILLILAGSLTNVSAQQGETRKFDEYGKLRTKDENARLDNLVLEMKSDPSITVYIISYGGRKSRPKDALLMANTAKKYSLKRGKFKSSRIVTMNGGYREEPMTEIWIVPPGANTPEVTPTVDPSEVMPPKVKRKTKKGKH